MRGSSYLLGVASAFCGIFAAGNAHAMPEFSDGVQSTLVFFHVVGVIAFMGNIVVSAMWMKEARRTRNPRVIQSATHAVMRADRIFMLPGILLILVTGVLTTGQHGGFPGKAWIELALTLFIVSGVIWLTVLLRLERRMRAMADQAVKINAEPSPAFYTTLRRWSMWGGIATLLPFIALLLMVFKPALWR
jgi:uncharacterized membrane protein